MLLGERLRGETARADETHLNLLEIDWRAFGDVDAMLDQIPVAPIAGPEKPSETWSGTSIVISDLTENWTQARVHELPEDAFARLTDPFADASTRPRTRIYLNAARGPVAHITAAPPEAAQATGRGNH